MDPQTRISQILKEDGAELVRQKKHAIWKLSNGQTFVLPCTPSDGRALRNAVKCLENILGLRAVAETKPIDDSPRIRPKKQRPQVSCTSFRFAVASSTDPGRSLQSELQAKLGSLMLQSSR